MQIITAENISLQPTSTDSHTSPKPHTQYTTTIILKLRWISIDSYPGKNHTEWLRQTIQMADYALRSGTAVVKKSFLFRWFCVPVIWTGAHEASVGTPHTGHAQGPLK